MDGDQQMTLLDIADDREALRQAFDRCPGMKHRISFEDALNEPIIVRCLAWIARNQLKRKRRK